MSKTNRATYKTHGKRLAERDGSYTCHYCGFALVPPAKEIQDDTLYYGRPYRVWQYDIINDCQAKVYDTFRDMLPDYRGGTVDHVIPMCKGGADDMSNLVLCCWECNTEKNVKTGDEYRAWKARKVQA